MLLKQTAAKQIHIFFIDMIFRILNIATALELDSCQL